jgi:hypothetical protein
MRSIIALVAAAVLSAGVPLQASAQGGEITMAILPFGALTPGPYAQQTLAQLGQDVVEFAQEADLYSILDRSTDRAIEQEMQRGQSYRNFDSRVKLDSSSRLNSTILLLGVVENETVTRQGKTRTDISYVADLAVRVKLVNTSTGELIKTSLFSLHNATPASDAAKKTGIVALLPKSVQDAATKAIDQQVSRSVKSGSDIDPLARTPGDAVQMAIKTLRTPLQDFLRDAYGAVLTASRKK